MQLLDNDAIKKVLDTETSPKIMFQPHELPDEIYGIVLSPATKDRLSKGQWSDLLEGMNQNGKLLKNAKIQLEHLETGSVKINFKYEQSQLIIPRKFLDQDITQDQIKKLNLFEPIGPFSYNGHDVYLKIDKELNAITMLNPNGMDLSELIKLRVEKEGAFVIGGYELTTKEIEDLCNNNQLNTHLYEKNGVFFTAHVQLTSDKLGITFSDLQQVQHYNIDKVRQQYNSPKASTPTIENPVVADFSKPLSDFPHKESIEPTQNTVEPNQPNTIDFNNALFNRDFTALDKMLATAPLNTAQLKGLTDIQAHLNSELAKQNKLIEIKSQSHKPEHWPLEINLLAVQRLSKELNQINNIIFSYSNQKIEQIKAQPEPQLEASINPKYYAINAQKQIDDLYLATTLTNYPSNLFTLREAYVPSLEAANVVLNHFSAPEFDAWDLDKFLPPTRDEQVVQLINEGKIENLIAFFNDPTFYPNAQTVQKIDSEIVALNNLFAKQSIVASESLGINKDLLANYKLDLDQLRTIKELCQPQLQFAQAIEQNDLQKLYILTAADKNHLIPSEFALQNLRENIAELKQSLVTYSKLENDIKNNVEHSPEDLVALNFAPQITQINMKIVEYSGLVDAFTARQATNPSLFADLQKSTEVQPYNFDSAIVNNDFSLLAKIADKFNIELTPERTKLLDKSLLTSQEKDVIFAMASTAQSNELTQPTHSQFSIGQTVNVALPNNQTTPALILATDSGKPNFDKDFLTLQGFNTPIPKSSVTLPNNIEQAI